MSHRPLLVHLAATLSLILASPDAGAADPAARQIAVILSKSLDTYDQVVTAFSLEVKGAITSYNMENDPAIGRRIVDRLRSQKPDLIFTIGPVASVLATQEISDIPIIFAMVPNLDKYGVRKRTTTGISLELPVQTQIRTIKTMARQARSIGVIYNPDSSAGRIEEAAKAAAANQLALVAVPIREPSQVMAGLKSMIGRIEALWMVPDAATLTGEAFDLMNRFALENRIPFFALTPRMVEAGALLSLSPGYTTIGRQAGAAANRILLDRVPAGDIPVAAPGGIEIAMNLTTAEAIGAECEIALKVFTYAATNRYPITVYK